MTSGASSVVQWFGYSLNGHIIIVISSMARGKLPNVNVKLIHEIQMNGR